MKINSVSFSKKWSIYCMMYSCANCPKREGYQCKNREWYDNMKNERYKLFLNPQRNTYDIQDTGEEILTYYNDLGHVCCSSAPAICDKLNEYENEVVRLKLENEGYLEVITGNENQLREFFLKDMVDWIDDKIKELKEENIVKLNPRESITVLNELKKEFFQNDKEV